MSYVRKSVSFYLEVSVSMTEIPTTSWSSPELARPPETVDSKGQP